MSHHDDHGSGCAGCERHLASELPQRDRRAFLRDSALLVAAAALAACGISTTDASSGANASGSITVSNYQALASVGGVATLTLSGTPVAVVRTGTTAFSAFSRVCPHQGGTIQTTSSGFQCPVHGATFNRSGQWIGGQQTSSMRSYATQYDTTTDTLTIG